MATKMSDAVEATIIMDNELRIFGGQQGVHQDMGYRVETALQNDGSNRLEGFTVISYDIARGSVAAYYPEANCLIPLSYNDKNSGTPSYKSVPVRITRRAA